MLGRYNRQKKAQGGDRKSEGSKDQNEPLISTAERLAAEHHVSPASVKRAGKFAEEVDAQGPEVAKAVWRGDKERGWLGWEKQPLPTRAMRT